MIPILSSIHEWYCPNCGKTGQTGPIVGTPMHICPRLRGLAAPMVAVGTAAKVEARDREDYAGSEVLTTDENGRPVMSIVTTRDNGTDCMVFAPLATVSARGD